MRTGDGEGEWVKGEEGEGLREEGEGIKWGGGLRKKGERRREVSDKDDCHQDVVTACEPVAG